MKLKYIVPVILALGLIALLNFGATTIKPQSSTVAKQALSRPMGAQNMQPLNFDSLLNVMKKKLSPPLRAKISLLEDNIANRDIKEQKIKDFEKLGDLWLQSGEKAIAARFYGQSGKLENSEKKLTFAAHLLSDALKSDEMMPKMKNWMLQEAITYYTASLAINPINDTVKMSLATIYMDAHQPMKGVKQLLDIVRRDSVNIPANVMLGKLAVQSGQLNKAIQRGQTILREAPRNIDARLFMGEAYKRKGNKEMAVKYFTEAKKIMDNPAFSKDVDDYMATFQNKTAKEITR